VESVSSATIADPQCGARDANSALRALSRGYSSGEPQRSIERERCHVLDVYPRIWVNT
jgi:hypothetical protein